LCCLLLACFVHESAQGWDCGANERGQTYNSEHFGFFY
jgi:hypothetical protein